VTVPPRRAWLYAAGLAAALAPQTALLRGHGLYDHPGLLGAPLAALGLAFLAAPPALPAYTDAPPRRLPLLPVVALRPAAPAGPPDHPAPLSSQSLP